MIICPNCGNILNEKEECDICGYNKNDASSSIINFAQPKYIELDELKKIKCETGKLHKLIFSSGISMVRSTFQVIRVDFDNKYIEKEENDFPNTDLNIIRYKVEDEDLNAMRVTVIDNNFAAWENLELNTMVVPSDVEKSLTIEFETEDKRIKRYNIYYFANMTKEERKIYNHFMEFIMSLMDEKNIIETKNEFFEHPREDNSFCPECGRILKTDKCECGYERK